MSWDSYIENLQGYCSGSCDMACIIGKDGSKWTTDSHASSFKLSPQEATTLGKCFTSGDFTPLQAGGIRMCGVTYQFLREEDKVLVLGKRKDHGGITIQASKTALVIGHTKEGGSHGNTNKGVAVIAEYLESLGM